VKDRYEQWGDDAELLAQIGRVLFTQDTRLTVHIPRALAEQVLASWKRDDEKQPLGPETAEGKRIRHAAGSLGLIGLSIEQRGSTDGEEVVVQVDAWQVGDALLAADEAGLLEGVFPPQHDGME
jgi:hypothetical protein